VSPVVHQHRDDVAGGEGRIYDDLLAIDVTTPGFALLFEFNEMLSAVDNDLVGHFAPSGTMPSAALLSNYPGPGAVPSCCISPNNVIPSERRLATRAEESFVLLCGRKTKKKTQDPSTRFTSVGMTPQIYFAGRIYQSANPV
jgi:hypothetical protein